MNDLAKEWEDRHSTFGRVDMKTNDPGRTAFLENAFEQASRIPLFATFNSKDPSMPSWVSSSHFLTVRILSHDDRDYTMSETTLRTPLINLVINRRATREFDHLALLAKDPEAYMRAVLAPMTGDNTTAQNEEELLDAIATAWVAAGSIEKADPEFFFAGSKYLGPSSHPEIQNMPECVKARKDTGKDPLEFNILIIPEPIMCSPWEWSPIDLMTRIARHHKRRGKLKN